MTNSIITLTGTVRDFKEGFKFFFVTPKDPAETNGKEVFVPISFLKRDVAAGSIAAGMEIVVTAYEKPDGDWASKQIVSLGGVEGVKLDEKPSAKKREVSRTRSLKKRPQTETPQMTLANFIDARQSHCKETTESGQRLFKIYSKQGDFVGYMLVDQNDVVFRQFPRGLSHNEVREVMGYRPILGTQSDKFGVKTNDPTLSQELAGRKQKKAA